ncbi:class I SAM-dependent methyltransferase [Candidatus Aminicenantes bacterium AH-873-B07]|jgi:SAM-dependent methyltransferase|nr:class I SAM-dependent methyltransferase [Candidatus Aminicenantes bacterium AH-873-B07]
MDWKNKFSRNFEKIILFILIPLFLLNCAQKKENKAEAFDKIARTLFKNVYPYLAKQIKQDYSINEGICVDVGAGPAYLSIELAKITDLKIYALDIDPDAIKIAKKNIKKVGLTGRIKAVLGDVHKMPFPDNFADLVVSRGSFIFWKDKVKAFKEIYRILKPGGIAFIGGGMGRLLPQAERERIRLIMERENIGPPANLRVSIKEMGEILRKAGIFNFEIYSHEGCICGLWTEFKKKKD